MKKYVVVFNSCGDLYSEEFDDYDEAHAFVCGEDTGENCGKYGADGENIGNEKAYIIKIESPLPCDFSVDVESHT